jgi:hypothetical protein
MSRQQNWVIAYKKLGDAARAISDSQPLCADTSTQLVFDMNEALDLVSRVRASLSRQIHRMDQGLIEDPEFPSHG